MHKERLSLLTYRNQGYTNPRELIGSAFKKLTSVEAGESEIVAAQVHRYMELRHMLEGMFRSMSNLKIEGYENFTGVVGPAIVYAPHRYSVDWLSICVAADQFLRATYKDQGKIAVWDLATWMGRYAGAIPVNGSGNFLKKVFSAFDRGEKVLMFPEGEKSIGKNTVGRALSQRIKDWPASYQKLTKHPECQIREIPLIPVGLDYVKPPSRRPLPLNIPTPWATHLTLRFGEPIYPSEHPEWSMDDYMRRIAELSCLEFAPDDKGTAN